MFDEDSFQAYCLVCENLIKVAPDCINDKKSSSGTGLKATKPIPPVFKRSKTGTIKQLSKNPSSTNLANVNGGMMKGPTGTIVRRNNSSARLQQGQPTSSGNGTAANTTSTGNALMGPPAAPSRHRSAGDLTRAQGLNNNVSQVTIKPPPTPPAEPHSALYCSAKCELQDRERSLGDLHHFQSALSLSPALVSPVSPDPASPLFVSGSESEDGSYFHTAKSASKGLGVDRRRNSSHHSVRIASNGRGASATTTESSSDSLASMFESNNSSGGIKKMTPLVQPLRPLLAPNGLSAHRAPGSATSSFDLENAIMMSANNRQKRQSTSSIHMRRIPSHSPPPGLSTSLHHNHHSHLHSQHSYYNAHPPSTNTFEPGSSAPATASLYANYAASFTRASSSTSLSQSMRRDSMSRSSSQHGSYQQGWKLSAYHSTVPKSPRVAIGNQYEDSTDDEQFDEVLEDARELRRRGRGPGPTSGGVGSGSTAREGSTSQITPTQSLVINSAMGHRSSLNNSTTLQPYHQQRRPSSIHSSSTNSSSASLNNMHPQTKYSQSPYPPPIPTIQHPPQQAKGWTWDSSEKVYEVPRIVGFTTSSTSSSKGVPGSLGEGKKLFYFEGK